MNRHPLNEGWKCADSGPGLGDTSRWADPGYDDSSWMPVPVPGDVNAVLVAAGRMPDPRHADNGRKCYWVTGRDWWYRLVFSIPPATRPAVRGPLSGRGVRACGTVPQRSVPRPDG